MLLLTQICSGQIMLRCTCVTHLLNVDFIWIYIVIYCRFRFVKSHVKDLMQSRKEITLGGQMLLLEGQIWPTGHYLPPTASDNTVHIDGQLRCELCCQDGLRGFCGCLYTVFVVELQTHLNDLKRPFQAISVQNTHTQIFHVQVLSPRNCRYILFPRDLQHCKMLP